MDLQNLALDALRDLGGDEGEIHGAKLASRIAQRAREENIDFHAFLKTQGLSFKAFVRQIGIRVTDFEGRDILVSLANGDVPTSPTPRSFARTEQIRKDVYDAFTRIEPEGYAYLVDGGRFVPAQKAGARPTVPVPPLTLTDVLQIRSDYAEQLANENADESAQLRQALNSPNPLKRFTSTLVAINKLESWRKFLYTRLQQNINAWATQNGVTIREDWFSTTRTHPGNSANKLPHLRRWLASLTDDELGNIMIPAYLVERTLKR